MNRLAQSMILVLLGGAVLRITTLSTTYLNYVKPGFRPFLIAAGALGAFSAKSEEAPAQPPVAELDVFKALPAGKVNDMTIGGHSGRRHAAGEHLGRGDGHLAGAQIRQALGRDRRPRTGWHLGHRDPATGRTLRMTRQPK
ncbi:hypothetical protein Aple_039770 [Acrocarpospora pleiomorpha]|uniref:Uncharacterized protein n=1 Tax=Acrocarpospora pleiomorpha TaxID=90975 RepID=A0A5M3XN49_9ACTN|nr:hypothetical protein Aple_039770 [Acrocarpospora pleiomorpha]